MNINFMDANLFTYIIIKKSICDKRELSHGSTL